MRKFMVTGMSCAACSARVEKAVSKVEGVTSCTVNLLTNVLAVEGSASDQAVIAAVEQAGYAAAPAEPRPKADSSAAPSDSGSAELRPLIRRLISSVVFLVLLMYLSMGHHMWGWPLPSFLHNPVSVGILQALLTVVILFINRKFFISGFKNVFHGGVNMDTLVGLGSGVAFAYSLYVLFALVDAQVSGNAEAVAHFSNEFYFESAAMILTLITVGKTLETYSKGKTTNALKSLMKLTPQTATVLRDGTEVEIPVSQVVIGDLFTVRPGQHIPVDGEVVEGSGAVNESALTGESIPVDKQAGSPVSAGTVNLTGFLRCRSTRVGEDTTLSQIIRMVGDAAATKAPVARAADKVSAVFVPIVLGLALITLIVWLAVGQEIGFALARAISVLVISCPCALGLATPVAIMVGNGVGARRGILFKTSAALEQTGKVRIVVLDKTGTVTSGQPVVTDLFPEPGLSSSEFLSLCARLESRSEHPLSRAILKKAEQEGLAFDGAIDDFEILPGNGLSARVDGALLAGGNLAFARTRAAIPDRARLEAERLAEEGKTPLFFTRDDRFLGIIAVADTIREDSAQAIRELKEMGLHVVMLTGDNERTARAIGLQAGVDEVVSDVLPDEKEGVIRRLQAFGKVAMVGDGINDAPALTRADVGIAIGAGTDVAIDAADVVLVKSRLLDVPAAIRLSQSTLRDIHQNLFWAFCYNVIGIPLAAGVWIPLTGWEMSPMFGAAAMSLSSVCVVLNALRLNLIHPSRPRRPRKLAPLPLHDGKLLSSECGEACGLNPLTLHIQGMMCEHCENRVCQALTALDGVLSAKADHKTGTAEVRLSGEVSQEQLKQAVEKAGYKLTKR